MSLIKYNGASRLILIIFVRNFSISTFHSKPKSRFPQLELFLAYSRKHTGVADASAIADRNICIAWEQILVAMNILSFISS